MDAVLQGLFVEVDYVAYLAIFEYEVGEELLFKEFAVLGDALEFEYHFVIDDEVKAQVVCESFAFVDDGHADLSLDLEALSCKFLGCCFFVDAFQQSRTEVTMHFVEALQDSICIALIHRGGSL